MLYKSRPINNQLDNGNDRLQRLATDLGDYHVARKQTNPRNNERLDNFNYIEAGSRLKTISSQPQDTKKFRYSSI